MNDAFGHPQTVVVFGGTSDIAGAVLRSPFLQRCQTVVLAGRDGSALGRSACRLEHRGITVHTVCFDAVDVQTAGDVVLRSFEAAGEPIDLVVFAVGELGHQVTDEKDPLRVGHMMTVNLTWPVAALTAAAAALGRQGTGRLLVLSSVAGYRLRRSNYIYGVAKRGIDGFSLELADTLKNSGVSLHVVRPGFVRTKMTRGMKAAPFAVSPDRVALDIARGMERGDEIIWSPRVLRWLFAGLRMLPDALWRRLPE